MRSKPDPVDQPERIMIVQCALLKCYTILGYSTVNIQLISVNIPLPPDQHHCSDEVK